AEEVRTGKLGGVCNMAASAASGAADANAGDAGAPGTPSASHCDLCGTPGFALAGSPALATGCAPVQQVALLELRSPLSAAVPGLPFGRGPPSFLN
ncbi:MAG: hypothetical protein JWQ72_3238, partial [Polaromonas sp.]|nr:hypothetical protein [Polaromonas sp.]